MKELRGKVAVVTGAASGIGRSLAATLAAEGCGLALWDVKAEDLDQTAESVGQAGVRVTTQRVDVSDRAAVFAAAEEAIKAHGQVDIVINNAGVTVIDSLEDVSFEDFEWVMGVNFWGVVYGVRAFLPHLEQRPEASIVNISSVNAFIPFPNNGPYNCSKFAVCGFNETLHQELAGTNVRVSSVHPGGIRTNIVRDARFRHSVRGEDHAQATNEFARIARTSPDEAARTIVRGIRRKQRRVLIGADAYFFDYGKRLAPKASVQLVRRMMNMKI